MTSTIDTATRSGIRKAHPTDAATLSHTLASAFRDDPIFQWFIPDQPARDLHLVDWFQVVVEALLHHDDTWCTHDAGAAALWVPPGLAPLTEEQESRLGKVTAAMGALELARFESLIELMEARHPHQPHLYLWFVGVEATRQGRGFGGHLLSARLAQADEMGVPAYLEATSMRNRALYERHGFAVTGELTVNGSPSMWSMWRDPR